MHKLLKQKGRDWSGLGRKRNMQAIEPGMSSAQSHFLTLRQKHTAKVNTSLSMHVAKKKKNAAASPRT